MDACRKPCRSSLETNKNFTKRATKTPTRTFQRIGAKSINIRRRIPQKSVADDKASPYRSACVRIFSRISCMACRPLLLLSGSSCS